jgi:hypothetical protein
LSARFLYELRKLRSGMDVRKCGCMEALYLHTSIPPNFHTRIPQKEQTETTVTLYNTLGQRVATLYEGTPQAGEQQRTQLDATGLSSGTYFLRLQAGAHTITRQVTVVR